MSEASVFRIDTPGIYGLSDADYLADPVVVPSLNNTTAKNLLISPAHAWASHPRLGAAPDAEWDSTDAQDVGHVAHQMFLLGENRVRVLNVTDFRTNKAKEMREAALAEGRIPLKLTAYESVRRVVDKLEEFRLRTGAFTQGKPEQTLIWTEDKEWARCKVDWLPDEPSAYLWDLKTTSGLADAGTFGRSQFGYDMQASFYPRGAECVRGEPPEGMRFCQIETKPPYGIKVFEFTPVAIEDAYHEVAEAIALWKQCRETDTWPSYPDDVEWIDIPPWKLRDREWRRQSGRGLARERRPADQAAVDMMLNTGNLGG
jgi:PDDEXK-like domain of unknown function (DUF3799)